MTIKLDPYFSFGGNTNAIMKHYQSIFGGELDVSLFKDMGGAPSPELEDGVMHSELGVNGQFHFMASDAMNPDDLVNGHAIGMALSGNADDAAELNRIWEEMCETGTVIQPLVAAPWGASFGMLNDANGVRWMFNIAA